MIAERLAAYGLSLRGGFNFDVTDNPPPGLSGDPAKAILLVGNLGAAFWPHFEKWRQSQPVPLENPLDSWSRTMIASVGMSFDARTVLPNDRPFLPFQQWAMRAERLRPSPLGILMHPAYGLWHAYRGALLFDMQLPFEDVPCDPHPCDDCIEKPCLAACPVTAHTSDGFAYQRSLEHVRGEDGAPCRERGCLDRNACPVGAQHRYPRLVHQFFMQAFAR